MIKKEGENIYYFIAVFLFIAMLMDISSYRIKNWFIIAGLMIGLGMFLFERDITQLAVGIFHMLLILAGLLPIFAMEVIGAADVKLFLLLGLFTGFKPTVFCILLSLFIGAIYSIFHMLYYKSLFQRFSYFYHYIKEVLTTNQIQPYHKKLPHKDAVIHFTIPIFLSFCIYWIGGISWMPF